MRGLRTGPPCACTAAFSTLMPLSHRPHQPAALQHRLHPFRPSQALCTCTSPTPGPRSPYRPHQPAPLQCWCHSLTPDAQAIKLTLLSFPLPCPHPALHFLSGRISLRHYSIGVTPSGLRKNLKQLLQKQNIPDLGHMQDVSEFVAKSGYGSVSMGRCGDGVDRWGYTFGGAGKGLDRLDRSRVSWMQTNNSRLAGAHISTHMVCSPTQLHTLQESEGEDAETSRVTLSQDMGRGNVASRQSRVRLYEIGPRMELEVIKVWGSVGEEGRVGNITSRQSCMRLCEIGLRMEEGLCDGKPLTTKHPMRPRGAPHNHEFVFDISSSHTPMRPVFSLSGGGAVRWQAAERMLLPRHPALTRGSPTK